MIAFEYFQSLADVSKECRDFFIYYDEIPTCGCDEISQEVTDTKEKVLKECGIKNASDTTAAEECCFWTHFSNDMNFMDGEVINLEALSKLLSPPDDEYNQEHLEQCDNIGLVFDFKSNLFFKQFFSVNQDQSDELYCDAIPKDFFKIFSCALRINAAKCENFKESEECNKLKADVEECLAE